MASLTPCRFYSQGSCRYGSNCRFYHEPRGQQQSGGFFGNKGLAPATFQPTSGGGFGQTTALNLNAKSNQNLDIIIEGVKKDMQEWQNCKIWPYSCYGPVGGKPCVPGFDDLSPEEYRLTFMQHGNAVPPEVTQRFLQIQQLRLNYQQATMENRTIIERIVTANAGTQQSTFGGQGATAQSLFGGASTTQQVGSIFGGSGNSGFSQQQNQQTSSIFGNSFGSSASNTFGQPNVLNTNTSLFQSQPAQAGGIFGGQQQTQTQLGFGAASPQQSTSLFQNPQQQQGGIFQSQAAAGPGSFITSTTSGGIFQQQQQQPPAMLGGSANPVQTSFFQQPQQQQQQQQSSTGLFQISQPPQQTQSNTAGIFTQPQTSLFTSQSATSGSIFGGSLNQPQTTSLPTTGSMFGGGSAGIGGNVISSQPQPAQLGATQKFIYSEESDLTPAELQAFKDENFSLESLPVKLPPQSLCL